VEQECDSPEFWPVGYSWRLDPSIPNCAPLVDFYSSPVMPALQLAFYGLTGDSSSSSSVCGTNSTGLAVPQPSHVGSNVLLAAIKLALAVVGLLEPGSEEEQQQEAEERMQALSVLLQETISMLDAFFEAHGQPTAAHAAAAANDQTSSSSSSSSDSRSSSSSSSSCGTSAAEVAWQIAAVAGSAAWSLVLCGVSAAEASTNSADGSHFVPALAVHLALLATAVQGLQDSTQAALSAWAVAAQHDATPTSRPQQQQQQGAGLCAGSSTQQGAAALCSRLKQGVLTQVGMMLSSQICTVLKCNALCSASCACHATADVKNYFSVLLVAALSSAQNNLGSPCSKSQGEHQCQNVHCHVHCVGPHCKP
jgi:hypothetical protein